MLLSMKDKEQILLTDAELSALIRASGRGKYLDVAFGGRLMDVESNHWAFKMLKEMRSNESNESEDLDKVGGQPCK